MMPAEIMCTWCGHWSNEGKVICYVCKRPLDSPEGHLTPQFRKAYGSTPEPPPADSNEVAVWDLVIADMKARDRFGEEKYDTRLRTNNGRDFLADAYDEALDLCVYLRGAIEERDQNKGKEDDGQG